MIVLLDSVMQELLLGVVRTKVCLGTKEAEIKLRYMHRLNPEEVGHAFINVLSHVPFAALYYIPRCIPACN